MDSRFGRRRWTRSRTWRESRGKPGRRIWGRGGIVGKYGGGFDCFFLFLFWNLIVVAIKIKFYFKYFNF